MNIKKLGLTAVVASLERSLLRFRHSMLWRRMHRNPLR